MNDAIENMKANAFSYAFKYSGLEENSIIPYLFSLFDSGNPGDPSPYSVSIGQDDTGFLGRHPRLRKGLKYGVPVGVAAAVLYSIWDQDKDSVPNWEEWLSGSSHTDPNSIPGDIKR